MIPQIDNQLEFDEEEEEVEIPSKTYKLNMNMTTKREELKEPTNFIGENILINNSINHKFDKFEINGNTKQETSKQVKNYFTGNKINSNSNSGLTISFDNSIVKIDGVSTIAETVLPYTTTKVKLPAGTYTWTMSMKTTDYVRNTYNLAFYLRDSADWLTGDISTSGISLSQLEESNFTKSRTFTLTEEKEVYFHAYVNGVGLTCNDLQLYCQIEEGESYTGFEQFIPNMPTPDYPSEIKSCENNINIIIDNGLEETNENYQSQKFTIPIQNKMFKNDKFIKNNDIYNEYHEDESINLNDITNWIEETTNAGAIRYYTIYNTVKKIVSPANNNTKADASSTVGIVSVTDLYFGTSSGVAIHPNGNIYISKDVYDLLSTTTIQLVYRLVNPKYVECTTEQITILNEIEENAHTYGGNTNIHSTDEISPIFNILGYTTKNVNIIVEDMDRIIGFVDDIEAIKQSVYHILSVERYSYDIYDDDYGVELEQYIGQDFDYIEATIEDTLEEALTQDERIIGVEVTNIEKLNIDSILVEFNVQTKNEEIEMEVEISV